MTDLVHGRDWYQYRPPPALANLPEEAVDGAGTVFRGARARVYHLLRIAAEQHLRFPIGQALGPPGEVPRHSLVEPWSGGASGDRRARELRSRHGFDVEHRPFEPPGGGESSTMLYRLVLGGEGVPAPHALLSGLRFHTAIGCPKAIADYGQPRATTARASSGSPIPYSCAGCSSAEEYRRRTLEEHRAGRLVPALRRCTGEAEPLVFYLSPDESAAHPWNPLAVLRRALTSLALGATDLGHLDLRAGEGGGA